MLILLVWKPEAASANEIEKSGVYFRARMPMGLARYKSACAARGVWFTSPLSVPWPNAPSSPRMRSRKTDSARHR